MQNRIATLFLIGISLSFVACSDHSHSSPADSPNVLTVQKAALPFDRSITVGDAFKRYEYIRNVRWTEAAVMGRKFIDVTGDLDADRLFSDLLKQTHVPEIEFARTHNLQEIEKQWKPKLSHMKLSCRFRVDADGSVQPTGAHFQEKGHGPWYLYGNDVNAVVRMVYYGSMPLFILDGFVHPSDGLP